jgi:ketosteroid isomerase-like protein
VARGAAGGVGGPSSGAVKGISMTVAEELLHRHIETLVADHARWQTMLADDIVWELPFAPALGHPARVSGRAEVVQFAAWFVGAVENFRFFDVRVQAFADPEAAVAEVKGEGWIKATGRTYRQDYVVFLRASGGKIGFLREYFDPTRAAKAMNATILDLEA